MSVLPKLAGFPKSFNPVAPATGPSGRSRWVERNYDTASVRGRIAKLRRLC